MNIIELFEKLGLQREAIAGYSPADIIRVEKQLNVERKLNPEIDTNLATNLVQALRDHAPAFIFVLSNRYLYNFFTGKDLARRNFPEYPPDIDTAIVSDFIARFLGDDLDLRLDQALAADRFSSIREFLTAHEYLPEESLHRLEKRMTGKLEFGIGRIPRDGKVDISSISYLRLMSFYEVLSTFSSINMDDKIRIVINRTSDMYNTRRERKFASDVMTCLPCYKAYDEELNRIMIGNREVVSSSSTTFSGSGSSGSGISGRVVFFVIIIVIKLIILTSRCSNSGSSYDSNTYDNVGYGNSGYGSGDSGGFESNSYRLRTNDVKAGLFADYLAMYNRDSISDVKPVDSIKTGKNPFRTNFTDDLVNVNSLPGDEATFTNRSPYDIVLLEFAGESAFNMPSYAYFLKSGHKLNLQINNKGSVVQEYSFYFGNNLASFDAGGLAVKRNDSLHEFRFRKLAPYCREILGKKFRFSHDVTITKNGGQLKIKSEGLKGVTDSLTNQGEYIF